MAIAATLLLTNCTKDISNTLNHNPKSASVGIATALFLSGERNLMINAMNTTNVGAAPFRVLSQEWAENAYVYESNYNFAAYNAPGGWFNTLYVGTIHQLELAKQNFPNNFLGTPGQLRNDIIISDILEIYSYYLLVSTYGNIPYSQAENADIPFPKYDDSKTIYADLLTRIDTCINGLSTADAAMGGADQIYGGDPTAWKKLAATLKFKMAMLNAQNDPTTTKTKVNEAITTGVFTSDADDALFTYDPSNPTNASPIWNAISYSGRHDFGPGALLVNTMNTLNDPREPAYFTLYKGKYVGGVAGFVNVYAKYSDFGPALYTNNLPGNLVTYSQVEFLLGEAAARGFTADNPATHYNNGIMSSIIYWGGDTATAMSYLANPAVAYGTAAGSWQQKFGYQEWIANYNNNWDSWTDIRRLGFPDINTVSPPLQPASLFPVRLYYPPNETTSNPTNTAAAVAALPGGQDVVTAKLFWEP